jgi:hypothetical protein
MKTKSIAIMMGALLCIYGFTVWGPRPAESQAATEQPGVITVTGDAEVRVVPDEVVLTLGVETWDVDLELAKRENDDRVRRVVEMAKRHGVRAEHIQTDYIDIEPRYEDNYEKRGFVGFFVRKTIVVRLRDISRFEDLLTGVLEEGVSYVHGIQFRTTELRKYRDEARTLAIRAAREKAVALAGELGEEVGRPRTVQEDHVGWWGWYNSWWGARWGGGMAQNVVQEVGGGSMPEDGSLAPGQITVNARVTVSFALE